MRLPCVHNVVLPKNMKCDKGYLQVFMKHNGHSICKNFGTHTKMAEKVASIFISKQHELILNGKIGIGPKLESKKFSDVANAWFKLWEQETNPDGTVSHNKESCYKVRWTLNSVLIPQFGKYNFDEIKEVQIYKWRQGYVDRGLSGTTANRYQAILSSIFSHVDKWVKTERIKPAFKLPEVNPCDAVEMAPTKKRERILSKYEASKLKMAFMQLEDLDGWEICKMALKSVLSMKDLKNLEIGQEIDMNRSKTGVRVNIPITNLVKLNWFGWRTRWDKARDIAGLGDVQFRDLRKTGINWLKGKFDLKLISEYAGHADISTTEAAYTIKQSEYLEPLARDIEIQVDSI